MEPMALRELLEAVDGRLLGEFHDLSAPVDRVDTDSRSIRPGSLFVPLAGERSDGHTYIPSALEQGAAGCLTARDLEHCRPDRFYVRVDDTRKALGDLAAYVRKKHPVPLIGVTGSVGKTTTKDMAAAVLGVKYRVLKTEGNFNSRVGLPLTLLRLEDSHELCVLELGMSQAGEIRYLSGIARPDVAVITNVGDAHIENLGSRENIFRAKCEIFSSMGPEGLAILNGDDPLLASLRGKLPCGAVFVGRGEGNDYRAVREDSAGGRLRCEIRTPQGAFRAEIPALGAHMVYPALTAAAVGERYGLSHEDIARGILRFEPAGMRMDVLHRGRGITILNDAYNANPQSMRAAIEVLRDSGEGRKVAVLGDMFELGSLAPALHAGVGECLGRAGIGCLVAVGPLSADMAQGARDAGVGEVYHCPDKEGAKRVLEGLIAPDTAFLVKASRGMKLEELADFLKERTEEA